MNKGSNLFFREKKGGVKEQDSATAMVNISAHCRFKNYFCTICKTRATGKGV